MKFLVRDALIFADLANALADGGKHEVIYTTPWQSGYPTFKDHAVGLGFERLKKSDKNGNPLLFWDHVKDADCIFFPDVHGNDAAEFIKKMYPNKSVWGSGRGERLEADRIFLKKMIEALGLDIMPYKVVKGLTALKAYIAKNPNKYVKINIWRGDVESFFCRDLDYNKADFIKLEMSLGPQVENINFIVEDVIDSNFEIGFDGFYAGDHYADKCFCGIEWKKNAYISRVFSFEDLPAPILETMEAMDPLLERLDWRGALSTEERFTKDGKHFLIDICSRFPAPLSALYPVFIKNWSEFVFKTGKRETCPLDIGSKYVGAFALEDMRLKEEYIQIDVKKADRDKVRFQSVTMHGGKYYGVKSNETACVLIAEGNSKEEVIEKLKDYSKLVDAQGLESGSVNGMEIILDSFKEGEKLGIHI